MPVTRCMVAPYTLEPPADPRRPKHRLGTVDVACITGLRPAPERARLPGRPLDEGTADAATSRAAGGDAQGLLRAGERRRPPRLADPRAVLRGLADLPRGPRPRVGHDLRRGGQRVARRRRLAQRRPGRDLGAVERGPRLRRGRRAEAVEGLGPDGRARARACGRRGGGRVREPRRRRDLVAAQHARRPARPRRTGTIPANQPPGHLGMPAILPHPDEPERFWASCRASASSRRPTTAPRGRRATSGLRADWPLEHEESASACTSS